ncbi:hypothetical protein F5B21DRAFT_512603 [Xylaria acuta]|nr:hypothetical protein F5B21DRAFT_512603 [Xylaria acuta]
MLLILFSSFPPELRQIIWGMFMDSLDDTSELLIHEPSNFHQPSGLMTPTVYTGFPALSHVNREAHYIAQTRASFVDCPSAQRMVPVRLFRPELDLQHLAVDICLSTNFYAFFRQAHSLRTLRFLVLSEHGFFNLSLMLILPTLIPRCALQPVTSDENWDEGWDREVALPLTTKLRAYFNQYLRNGYGFAEMGGDDVAELVLPVT